MTHFNGFSKKSRQKRERGKPSLQQTIIPTKPQATVIMLITMLTDSGTENMITCPDWKLNHWTSKLDASPEIISYQVTELF